MKELVIAGLLLASRDIIGGVEWCRAQTGTDLARKVEQGKKAFAGCEIKGKKLGSSDSGQFISVNAAWMLSCSVKHIMDADIIYRECDYITVHVPLLDSTRHMISEEALDKMKNGVVILNFARDLLVDDDAMEAALKSGKVKKYVTDFPNEKTFSMNGVIAIPHLGASTREAEDNCAVMAVEELRDYLENGAIKNSVNYPECSMGVCTECARIALLHANIPNMIGQIAAILAAENLNIVNMYKVRVIKG